MDTGNNTVGETNEHKYSAEQMNLFFLEQEQLFDRIERAETHYQSLGVERLASSEEIKLAYLRSMALLNPAHFGINIPLPDSILDRVDQAYDSVARAYSTLVSFRRRIEYDESLRKKQTRAAETPNQMKRPEKAEVETGIELAPEPRKTPESSPETIKISRVPQQKTVYTKPAASTAVENRRRSRRFRLSIPVRVTGCDRNGGKWQEMTQSVDISNTGILLRLTKPVRTGTVLYMTLPMPRNLRNHSHYDASYSVYALVRRMEPRQDGHRVIGVEFIGQRPPNGYIERPWATFRTGRWSGGERRRNDRRKVNEPVAVEYFMEPARLIGREYAVTENISSSGMRVLVKDAPREFDYVRVKYSKGMLEGMAAVADRYVGKDNLERLCLRLLTEDSPTGAMING